MTEQMKMKTWSWSGDRRTWRLDPPDCDCDKLCKNPEHDKPEWRLVHGAEVVKVVNTGDLKSPGR